MEKIFIILFLTNINLSFAQNSTESYQTGTYKTYVNLSMNDIKLEDTILVKKNYDETNLTFRLWDSKGERIKEPFAVTDGKNIYLRANSVQNHLTNKLNDRLRGSKNAYYRAIFSNKNYIYFDSFFHSSGISNWRFGARYRAGIIYDISKGTFTAFYTIDDLNSFLKQAINAEMGDEYLEHYKLKINTVWFAMTHLFDYVSKPHRIE